MKVSVSRVQCHQDVMIAQGTPIAGMICNGEICRPPRVSTADLFKDE